MSIALNLILVTLCLLRSSEGIFEGQKIGINELPFLVHGMCVPNDEASTLKYVFTGMILTKVRIITHCHFCGLQNCKDHRIQAGMSHIPKNTSETFGVASFGTITLGNSPSACFCTMTLDRTLELGGNIQVTPFAFWDLPLSYNPSDKWLVAGWGRTEKETAPKGKQTVEMSKDLRATISQHLPNCAKFYGEASGNDNLFCLGRAMDQKTTFGDQGGPVYSLEQNVVYGMIINGEGNDDFRENENDPEKPMLMVRISMARPHFDLMRLEDADRK